VDLPTQDRDLMPQNQQLDILGAVVAGELDRHLQNLAQQQIDQRRAHNLGSSLRPTAALRTKPHVPRPN